MTEDFNEIKPGAQAVAESVTRKRAALEAKHIILTDRPEDVAAYLPKYHHTMHEIIEIGPWQSYGAFREGAGRNMTRLFLSDEARVACAEQLSRLTDVQKRASYLFSYEDVADWIHENVESEVMGSSSKALFNFAPRELLSITQAKFLCKRLFRVLLKSFP